MTSSCFICRLKNYLIILCFGFIHSQSYEWKSVIVPNDNWNYIIPQSELPDNWKSVDFDWSNWSLGPTGIGYGDDDDNTIIENTISLFIRKNFQIVDINDVNRVILDIDFDDGFIAYLNGKEIARYLVSGNNVAYNQTSDNWGEAFLYRGLAPKRYFIDKNLFNQGDNVLAIQVHNYSIDSSDLSIIPVLSVEVNSSVSSYREPPNWFSDPGTYNSQINFSSSNLPIVILETNGNQEIPNEPKIEANMKIIERQDGSRNYVSDQDNSSHLNYSGNIQIEVRGSSSTLFSKQQYALTTYDDSGEKDNVNLLDLPKENDWILSGIAYDTTFVRDYVSYKLSNLIGEYASRGRYCELILNDEYRGIYILFEKLKSDDSRIDLNKIQADDNELPNLSGGYITKSDKIEGGDVRAWSMPNYGGWETNFVHEYPKPENITSEQNNYIKNIFEDLYTKAENQNKSIYNGYPSVIDVPSFLNFILINELASNVDAYEFSTFFHKDRNGKLRAGPVWDFNLTYGNDLFSWGFDRSKINVWQHSYGNMGAKFWKNLFDEPYFKCYLSKRWIALTSENNHLSENNINSIIDSTAELISEAVSRQEQVWGFDIEFDERISLLKEFIRDRIYWMSMLLNDTSLCENDYVPNLIISKIHYHPKTLADENSSDLEFIEITNSNENSENLTGVYFGGLGFTFHFPNDYEIDGNKSIFLANDLDVFKTKYGFDADGEFSRNLSNGGEDLVLYDAFGNLIDFVEYDDKSPWPEEPDGDGPFLKLKNLNLNNNVGTNWEPSSDFNTLSADKNSFDNTILIYPNPASNVLKIQTKNNSKILKIIFYDLSGKLVKSYNPNTQNYSLDISNFGNGVYIIESRFDGITQYSRVIKN